MNSDPQAPILRGRLVRLRAVEPDDWESYFDWNFDDEQARTAYFIPLPQSREAVRRWAEQEAIRRAADDNFRYAIVRVSDDIMMGNLSVHDADPRIRNIHLWHQHQAGGAAQGIGERGNPAGAAVLFRGATLPEGDRHHLQLQ